MFEPPFYRAGVQAMPQTAKLLRQYENGGFDDVSNDPNVKVTEPKADIAKIEKVDGGWKVSPVAAGMTKMTATLGDQTATMPIEFSGGDATAGTTIAGTLIVNPSTLSLWSGETQTIGNAAIDPGGGQPPRCPARVVTVKAPDDQGIVSVDGNKITGRSVGDVTVTVSAGGQSATVNVHVSAADSIYFNPPEINLAGGPDGAVRPSWPRAPTARKWPSQAQIESMDKNVLDVDPPNPANFVARAQGQTQLQAVLSRQGGLCQGFGLGQAF